MTAARRNPSPRRAVTIPRLLLAAALAPLLGSLAVLLGQAATYTPTGDQAIIERSVRLIGSRAVLLGPYSRFGWHHPGPALFYLLAAPYRLLGQASVALPLATLVLNLVCVAGIAAVLRRRAGTVAMVWGLLVLAGYLHAQNSGFLVDDWNPYLPMLPFCLGVLLCWSLLAGERRPLPVCLAVATLCVQSHVGYGIGVAAVGGATAVGLLLLTLAARRDPNPPLAAGAWRWPLVVACSVTVFLWAPVVLQQLTGHPGNLTQLADYFGRTRPSWTYAQGVRELSTSVGWLPALVTGTASQPGFLTPAELPTWTGVVGAVAAVGAALLIALRHRGAVLFAGLVAVLCAAVVVAVQRVVGMLFTYLVPFTWAAGVLAWMLVGVTVSLELRRHPWARLPVRLQPVAVLVAAVGLLLAFVPVALRTTTPTSVAMPELRPLTETVLRWSAQRPGELVKLDAAPSTGLVGATYPMVGLFVRLERAKVPVRVPAAWDPILGPSASAGVQHARWLIVVALTDGSSAPPARGQQVLARFGPVQAYVSRLPALG